MVVRMKEFINILKQTEKVTCYNMYIVVGLGNPGLKYKKTNGGSKYV